MRVNGYEIGPGKCLSGSDLSESNLSGSNLRWSNLRWSNLSESDLRKTDLRWSDLRWSDLRDSDLRGSNLRGSNLRWSDLRGSDLSGSDLSESNLSESNLIGSNLSGSNLSGSNLSGSNLTDAVLPPAPSVQQLNTKILAAIEDGDLLDMIYWHRWCGTHRIAGWAVTLAGDEGRELEKKIGTNAAAALIFAHSGTTVVPDFFAYKDDAIRALKERAAKEMES